jgi:hypothetical protein
MARSRRRNVKSAIAKDPPMSPFGESMVAAATTAALGISPWILPLIAIAAKRKETPAHRHRFVDLLRRWSSFRRDRQRRDRIVMDRRIRAKLEATIWPD